MTVYPKDVVDLFTKTKAVLQEQGWCQDLFEGPRGERDIIGAMNTAFGVNPTASPTDGDCTDLFHDLRVKADKALVVAGQISVDPHGEDDEDSLTNWNDAEGRTKDEVLALLDAGIKEVSK